MFHNRTATELLSHFSTVGPSPQTPPHADSSATPNPTAGPRLVVLPPFSPGTPQPTLLPKLLQITAHRCATFFAEAAVLVLIFGILDRLLSRGHVELLWIAGTLAASLTLLAASVLTDLSRTWSAPRDH